VLCRPPPTPRAAPTAATASRPDATATPHHARSLPSPSHGQGCSPSATISGGPPDTTHLAPNGRLACLLWEQRLAGPSAQVERTPCESTAVAGTPLRQRCLRAEEFLVGLIGVALLRLSAADGLTTGDRPAWPARSFSNCRRSCGSWTGCRSPRGGGAGPQGRDRPPLTRPARAARAWGAARPPPSGATQNTRVTEA